MNLGFSEMAFIFILALIIFGPKKLPEIGRQIGKALAEFKRASNEFKWQLEAEMRQIEAEAARERLAKAAPTTPEILPPTSAPKASALASETRSNGSAVSSEVVEPMTVTPEELKGPDA